MKRIFFFLVMAAAAVSALAQEKAQVRTIYISDLYTTHIVFPAEVTYIDRSSPKDVRAQVIEKNRNMIRVRATNPFEGSSSLSVLESNGNIHTFFVKYVEQPTELIIDVAYLDRVADGGSVDNTTKKRERSQDDAEKVGKSDDDVGEGGELVDSGAVKEEVRGAGPVKGNVAPTLSDVLEYKRGIFHIGEVAYGLQCMVDNILVYHDVTYIVLSLDNQSAISYSASDPVFFTVESRKKAGKRDLPVNNDLSPRSRLGNLFAQNGQRAKAVFCFDKITLTRDQVLKVRVYEDMGQRNFEITLSAADINNAVRYVER